MCVDWKSMVYGMVYLDLWDVHPYVGPALRALRIACPILGIVGPVGKLLVVAITRWLWSLDARTRGTYHEQQALVCM